MYNTEVKCNTIESDLVFVIYCYYCCSTRRAYTTMKQEEEEQLYEAVVFDAKMPKKMRLGDAYRRYNFPFVTGKIVYVKFVSEKSGSVSTWDIRNSPRISEKNQALERGEEVRVYVYSGDSTYKMEYDDETNFLKFILDMCARVSTSTRFIRNTPITTTEIDEHISGVSY